MALPKPTDTGTAAENGMVVLGALLLATLFYGGGFLGSKISADTDIDTLIGLLVGVVAWTFVYGALIVLLTREEPVVLTRVEDEYEEEEEEEEDEPTPKFNPTTGELL